MRNDKKGRIEHGGGGDLVTFYASGEHGPEVRADGKGGSLKRGYYARSQREMRGPFTTRKKARDAF